MTKTLNLLETLNIVGWYNQLTEEKLNAIPMKVRFALKRAVGKLLPDVKEFETLRDEEINKIQEAYSSNEKSYPATETVVDSDGNPVLDADGNEQTQELRKIKDEYLEEYQDQIKALNAKLAEVLSEKSTYEYNGADVDAMVDGLDSDTPLEWNDINIIDALLTEEA